MRTSLLIVGVMLVLGITAVTYMSRSVASDPSNSSIESQSETRSRIQISGRVINAAGEAIAGAKVFVDEDNSGGALISSGVSDKQGNFSIELRGPGNYTVYGSKEEDGYPLTVSGFHKQVPLDQIPKLRITDSKPVENVILQLGQSAAFIEGTINDSFTNKPVRTATITLRRGDDPNLSYGTSTQGANPGEFKVVVPTEPFTTTVESPGYEPWTYGNDGLRVRMPQSMKLNRGEVRKLQVALRRIEK